MNEPKSNKAGINDTKELDEKKIIGHTLHLHYRSSGIEAQQAKNTKRTHHGGFLPVAGCECVPAAPAVVILLTGGGLVDVDATADEL